MRKIIFWGISFKQFVFILLFYICIGTFYYITITIAEFESFNRMPQLVLFYLLIAMYTAPIWWFYFIANKEAPFRKKIFFHLVTCPLFVFALIISYQFLADIMMIARLKGKQAAWDINYATLVYGLQFGIFHFYDYYLRYKEKLMKENEFQQLKLQNEIQLLKSQLEPHFLFNTLNSISASVPRENEKTRVLISKLADVFRYALECSKQEYATVETEIAFIKTYLDLEKERYTDKLQIVYTIDPLTLDAKIPSMLLQPLIENAIKHGISNIHDKGAIMMAIEKKEQMLFFEIKNTGLLLDIASISKSTGIGLKNTNLRLQKLYQQNIELFPVVSGGLHLKFKIPYEKFLNAKT